GDRDVIVSGGGSGDGTVRVWDQHGRLIGDPLDSYADWISAVAVGRLGDRDVIVSGGGDGDGTVRVWDQHGRLIGDPLDSYADWISAVAVG
ncbi:hypothetical protein AB0C00_02180, partial [Micromonospora carbonacea]